MRFVLGFLTSALCLAILLYGLDLKRLSEALQMLEMGLIIPAMVLTVLTFGLKSQRWRRLMYPCHRYSWSEAFYAYVIGHMVNYILPLRAGDLARVLVITKSEGGGRSAMLASVVTERILDVGVLLLLAVFAMLVSPWSGWPYSVLWLMLGVIVASLTVVIVLRHRPEFVVFLAQKVDTLLPFKFKGRISQIVLAFISGFTGLGSWQQYSLLALETVVIWGMQVGVIYMVIVAFGLNLSYGLGPTAALVVLVMISLAISVPSLPGTIGTYHLGAVVALGLFGVDKNSALTYAIIQHLLGAITVYILGAWGLYKSGLGSGFLTKVKLAKYGRDS